MADKQSRGWHHPPSLEHLFCNPADSAFLWLWDHKHLHQLSECAGTLLKIAPCLLCHKYVSLNHGTSWLMKIISKHWTYLTHRRPCLYPNRRIADVHKGVSTLLPGEPSWVCGSQELFGPLGDPWKDIQLLRPASGLCVIPALFRNSSLHSGLLGPWAGPSLGRDRLITGFL